MKGSFTLQGAFWWWLKTPGPGSIEAAVGAAMRCALLLAACLVCSELPAQDCLPGTLLEPYLRICADINDVRDEFIPPSETSSLLPSRVSGDTPPAPVSNLILEDEPPAPGDEPPVPGTMSAGTRFNVGSYQVTTSSHLHTKMMVYPNGLGVPALPSWIYTTSTNRTHLTIELVGMYRSWSEPKAVLGLFAWPCFEDYPCPDGDTSSGWQFWHSYDDLACNITQIVDQGGHAQKILHYANHADRLDDNDPPAWKNAVYLWNYCEAEWDLIWQHEYRQSKTDCSLNNSCAWWGPVFELFGSERYPEIPELGYEQGLLIYDGIWSELRPAEGAGFIDPAARPELIPWQLFHLDSNRGFGAGNWFDINDPPVIDGQQPLQVLEDEILTITTDSLVITDPDIDPTYHVSFELSVFGGDNYTSDGLSVTPAPDYFGMLTVPVTVNDGAADSPAFDLLIDVLPVNDPPAINSPIDDKLLERGVAVTLDIGAAFSDPDQDALAFSAVGLPASLTLSTQGIIAGTPSNQDNLDSPFLVTITATDPEGLSISEAFAISVVIVDTDGDQIPNDWELEYGQDPLDPDDAGLDPDDDGLTTLEEYQAGTDPRTSDTDNDGLSDEYELDEGLDPLDGICPSWICIDFQRGWRASILRRRE